MCLNKIFSHGSISHVRQLCSNIHGLLALGIRRFFSRRRRSHHLELPIPASKRLLVTAVCSPLECTRQFNNISDVPPWKKLQIVSCYRCIIHDPWYGPNSTQVSTEYFLYNCIPLLGLFEPCADLLVAIRLLCCFYDRYTRCGHEWGTLTPDAP